MLDSKNKSQYKLVSVGRKLSSSLIFVSCTELNESDHRNHRLKERRDLQEDLFPLLSSSISMEKMDPIRDASPERITMHLTF